jgi:hypothetical protein
LQREGGSHGWLLGLGERKEKLDGGRKEIRWWVGKGIVGSGEIRWVPHRVRGALRFHREDGHPEKSEPAYRSDYKIR